MGLKDYKGGLEAELKVMVIDNDIHLLTPLRRSLLTFGLDVEACESGIEAMLNSIVGQYDYIVTDYHLPGMNGVELTRRLRRKFPHAVIIGMSANDVEEQFLRSGANDFLLKPFVPYQLAMMITGSDILA